MTSLDDDCNFLVAEVGFPQHMLQSHCLSHSNKDRDWENEELSTVGENQAQDHVRNLNMHKSMKSDELHLWVLKDLANEVVKPLPIVFENSWQSSEVPLKRENNLNFWKGNKEDPENYRLVRIILVLGKIMEKLFLEMQSNIKHKSVGIYRLLLSLLAKAKSSVVEERERGREEKEERRGEERRGEERRGAERRGEERRYLVYEAE
ncbi:hypothetical protein TURU_082955 [Turdus rufiventris]|nr:hypothetical protein TURU_082955 [Turdus rufiventris]